MKQFYCYVLNKMMFCLKYSKNLPVALVVTEDRGR